MNKTDELMNTLLGEATEDDENFGKEILAVYKKYKTSGVFIYPSKRYGMVLAATAGKTDEQVRMILLALLRSLNPEGANDNERGKGNG